MKTWVEYSSPWNIVSSALRWYHRNQPTSWTYPSLLHNWVPAAGMDSMGPSNARYKKCLAWLVRYKKDPIKGCLRIKDSCQQSYFFLQRSGMAPTIFLFVVDTCQEEENLQALKASPVFVTRDSLLIEIPCNFRSLFSCHWAWFLQEHWWG